jgi:hypothetical protein
MLPHSERISVIAFRQERPCGLENYLIDISCIPCCHEYMLASQFLDFIFAGSVSFGAKL